MSIRMRFGLSLWGLLAVAGCGGDEGGGGSGGGGGSSAQVGVACAGGALCTAGQSCCVPASGAATCATSCSAASAFACDGPEDCGGAACCGNFSEGFACSSTGECEPGTVRRCHAKGDCADAEQCVPATVGGVPSDACAKI